MDKKEIKKRKRRRNRLIKTFVLVVAIIVAVGTTFGVTMSYFGGKSSTSTYDMVLKTGLYVNNAGGGESVSGTTYVVPSQVVTANCEVSVKSASTKTDTANTGDSASDALIRAIITFSSDDEVGATLDDSASFPVTIGSTVVGNFMKYTDGNYYLISGTTISASSEMYVIKTSEGEKTLTFDMVVSIPKTIGNASSGKKVTLTVTYQVVQADFFSGSSTAVAKTVANAKTIFDDTSVSGDASYSS